MDSIPTSIALLSIALVCGALIVNKVAGCIVESILDVVEAEHDLYRPR